MNTQHLFPTLRPVLGAADLAEALFGDRSKSSVITNWRARIADFPPERRKGELDLVAVHDWMQENRRDDLVRLAREGRVFTPLWWWAQSVRAYADAVTVPVARRELLALILLAHRLLADDDAGVVSEVVDWMGRLNAMAAPSPDLAADLAAAISRLAARVEASHEPARGLLVEPLGALGERGSLVLELFRRLFDAVQVPGGFAVPGPILQPVLELREDQRRGKRPETATPDALAVLMAKAAKVDPHHSVLDPACGEGELLVAAFAEALKDFRQGVPGDLGRPLPGQRYAGCEINGALVATARTRLDIVDCLTEVRAADFLEADPFGDELFDVVLVDPPMPEVGTRRLKGWMGRWLVAALRHTRPEGRLVMLLPDDVLPEGADAAGGLLDELLPVGGPTSLRDFRVEHVVLLPRRIRTDIDGGACLVVLHVGKTAASGSTVRLSDFRSLDPALLARAANFLGWGAETTAGALVDAVAAQLGRTPTHDGIHPEQLLRLRERGVLPEERETGAGDTLVDRLRAVLTPLLESVSATAPEQVREARRLLDEVDKHLTSVPSRRKSRTTGGTS